MLLAGSTKGGIVHTVRHETGCCSFRDCCPNPARTKSLLARQKSQATDRRSLRMMAERDENSSMRSQPASKESAQRLSESLPFVSACCSMQIRLRSPFLAIAYAILTDSISESWGLTVSVTTVYLRCEWTYFYFDLTVTMTTEAKILTCMYHA